jgi:hypothetical protein
MKKLLGIVVLGFLLSGNAYSENINLKCEDPKINIPMSVLIDEQNKLVSWQGSAPDYYHYENGVFSFAMTTDEFKYSYRLNRNTGVLIINAFKFSKEEFEKILEEVVNRMFAAGKTSDDKSYLVKLIVDKYDEENPEDTIFMECKKVEAKF